PDRSFQLRAFHTGRLSEDGRRPFRRFFPGIGAIQVLKQTRQRPRTITVSSISSYAQAATEKGWPGYNFDVAHSAFEEAFNVGDLLHGRYPELTLLVGDAP